MFHHAPEVTTRRVLQSLWQKSVYRDWTTAYSANGVVMSHVDIWNADYAHPIPWAGSIVGVAIWTAYLSLISEGTIDVHFGTLSKNNAFSESGVANLLLTTAHAGTTWAWNTITYARGLYTLTAGESLGVQLDYNAVKLGAAGSANRQIQVELAVEINI